MNKICSVLIPTRKRPQQLIKSINSIFSTCNNRNNIEVIIKIDTDDTSYNIDLSMYYPHIKVVVSPRPKLGYIQMADIYKEMGDVSVGEFLFIFNDDALIVSKNWDLILEEYSQKISILHSKIESTQDNEFPIIHRDIPKITGNFGKHPSIDRWFQMLGEYANIIKLENRIIIKHIREHIKTEHDKDRLPSWNPRDVYKYREYIKQEAELIKSYVQ